MSEENETDKVGTSVKNDTVKVGTSEENKTDKAGTSEENKTDKAGTSEENKTDKAGTSEKNETNKAGTSDQNYEGNSADVTAQSDATHSHPLRNLNPDKFKLAVLYIRDMLKAEQVNDLFRFEEFTFLKVYICGKIVSVKEAPEFCVITVSDGTGKIPCVYYKDKMEKLLYKSFHIPDMNMTAEDIKTGTGMMSQSMKYLQKSIPRFRDLQNGIIVKIIGQLKNYQDERQVTIQRIINESSDAVRQRDSDTDAAKEHKKHMHEFYQARHLLNAKD